MALTGDWFLDSATSIVNSICDCSQAVIGSFNNVKTLDIGGAVATTVDAAATTVATLLVVIELCTHAMGFHFDDINDAVRFAFKVVVYKIILENSSKIVGLVYGLFMDEGSWSKVSNGFNSVKTHFSSVASDVQLRYSAITDPGFIGVENFFAGLAAVGAALVVVFLCVNIIASIAGLLFELCINVAIAPVPLATLVNSQTRQIGINFIKGFAGNCLTLTMYTVCFTVFDELMGGSGATAFNSLFAGKLNLLGPMLSAIAMLLLLSVAIKNVSTMISKVLS